MVVYDCLSYFAEYADDVILEGYDGFRIEERGDKYYVVYKEIRGDKEIERRFLLSDSQLNLFMQLQQTYQDFFQRQKFLFNILVQLEQKLLFEEKTEENIELFCSELYNSPENYIHFVAMNMTLPQFCAVAKERILFSHDNIS